jgi:molybdate/tungstate transport system substrate-binding protein
MWCLCLGSAVLVSACRDPAAARSAPRPQPVVVFNAAALGPPFRALGDSLRLQTPSYTLQQENAPSLEAIRRVTELGRVPDVLATADVALFDQLIVPTHADWYVIFGTNALVLAYGPHSQGRAELSPATWWRVLLRRGIGTGRSDPGVDPSGYRTLMALQLAERHYGIPGLAARLRAAMPARYVRHAEADLSALLQAGELDYIWTYRNLARAHRLEYLDLPVEVNLSDPARAEWYAHASAKVAEAKFGDSLELRGAPIVFAATVPRAAPHRYAGQAFIEALLSPRGQGALRATGFDPLTPARVVGRAPPWVTERVKVADR